MNLRKLQLQIYRALIFGPATWYIFFKGHYYPDNFYETWQPISFYHLLSGPWSQNFLDGLRYLWFIFCQFTFISLYPRFYKERNYRLLSVPATILAILFLGHDYNFGTIYHGTHLYVAVCLLLSLAPKNRKNRDSPYDWHIPLIKSFISFMLFSAGLQKIFKGGVDWFTTDALFIKMALLPAHPPLASLLLEAPLWVHQLLGFIILIGVQLSAPLALISPVTGLFYFILWSLFHIGASLIFSVGTSFYSQIFCYAIFLSPSLIKHNPLKRN